MPGKYKVESNSNGYTLPADDTLLDFDFSLPPGFYPSILIYAWIENGRGGIQCYMRDAITEKYKMFLDPKFSKFIYGEQL